MVRFYRSAAIQFQPASQYIGITSGRIDYLIIAVALDTGALLIELLT